jgi:hypothetical protein
MGGSAADFRSRFTCRFMAGGLFSVNSLFHHEFYPFLLKAVLGNFAASPGFGFTKRSSTIPMEGGAFVKADSCRYGPLRSL